MNIMERNLPVAESIGEGDKVRIVTAAGNSKNVDKSAFDNNVYLFNVKVTQSGSDWVVETDETLQNLETAWEANKFIVAKVTVAPTGYPESYWQRYDAIVAVHTKGVNFIFNGHPSNLIRDDLVIQPGGWQFTRTNL